MYAQRRDRRQLDRIQRRAAANRRIGHDHAYLIVVAPYLSTGLIALALAGGAAWSWLHVNHHRISLVVFAIGVLCALAYGVWFVRAGSMHSRMMQRATGQIPGSPWPWHGLAAASVMLLVASYLIYVP